MLIEERYRKILDCLRENGTVTVSELTERLAISEATIRRDLAVLAGMGRLLKVRGGATLPDSEFSFEGESNVESKEKLFSSEKVEIARYAATTVRRGDFIFLDAGTTTEKMIDFITEKDITVVTNSFTHARRLAQRGFRVTIIGGQVKSCTEAIVGAAAVESINRFNFTKCYLGTNGISLTRGFTTPDIDEADVKSAAFRASYIAYVLTDHSKFDRIAPVTFAPLSEVCLITDTLPNEKYRGQCVIKEVLK